MGGQGFDKDPIEWSDANEASFFIILYERVKNHPNGTPVFKTTDWQEMCEELFIKTGVKYTTDQLSGKYNRMRRKQRDFEELLENTGVTYDSNANIVFASENTWQELFKKSKNFKPFRKFGCKNFALLGQDFGKSTATGLLRHASTQLPPESDEERENEDDYMSRSTHVDENENEKSEGGSSKGNIRVKKKAKMDKIDTCVEMWSTILKARIDKYKNQNDKATSPEFDPFFIEECMDKLESMSDISDASYNEAIRFFTTVEWRKIFLKISETIMRSWLKSLEK